MSQSNLDPAGMLSSTDRLTSPVSTSALDSDRVEVSLTMSAEAYAMLERLARSTRQELEDVIGKAFLLYQAAVEAQKDGKAVGVAPNDDVLETVFTGL